MVETDTIVFVLGSLSIDISVGEVGLALSGVPMIVPKLLSLKIVANTAAALYVPKSTSKYNFPLNLYDGGFIYMGDFLSSISEKNLYEFL